jgi:hypothetical protein
VLATTWDQVAALRLERQHLAAPAPRARMLDVVRDHVAVQAQVMSSAELAIRARVAGLRRDDVREALWNDRTLVKTWAMRGTLHLVASDELPELVGGLGTRINYLRPVWLRYFQVTAEEMLALQDAIGEVLTDEPMSRGDLARALAIRLGDEAFAGRVMGSWGTFLKPAAGRGFLCFGPGEGGKSTFVDPRAWLGRAMPEPSEEAVAAVIVRQLHAFPGSTKGELARWWGVQGGAPINRPLALLKDRLAPVSVEGTKALVLAEDLAEIQDARPATGIRLLGGFDPYTLSLQKEAEPLLPMARRPLVSRTAGWISAVILDGGRVAGTWTHEVGTKRVAVTVSPWRRLSKAERTAVERETDAIGGFVAPDAPVEVTIADPA